MDEQGNVYTFEAPPSEIQPAFEETWNGFVAMVIAIDEQGVGSGAESFTNISFTLLGAMVVLAGHIF